ncbi:MAG: GDSL-type esterase/lipase family protein [Holophagaceae bacterium]
MTKRAAPTLALLAAAALVLPAAGRPKHPRKRPASRRPAAVKPMRPVPVRGIEGAEALAPFLAALAQATEPQAGRMVRVMQFGDSHTAADFWTGRLRQRLQARFGDAGPGLLMSGRPWRGYHHDGVQLVSGVQWPGESLRSREATGWVGLAGAAVEPPAGEPLRVQGRFADLRLHLLGGSGALPQASVAPLAPAAGDEQDPAPARTLDVRFEAGFAGGECLRIHGLKGAAGAQVQEVAIALPEGAKLLGLELLSGTPGVVYDELGLNGAELTDLERWNPELRKALLAQARPDLLVLAYGTNEAGRRNLDPADYVARARVLLEGLKADSGASILVVGPLDRLARRARQRAAVEAGATQVAGLLRQAARESGCAYWDARAAMGGPGAILKWRKAGLAQRDLVHLTSPGYQKLGDLLADELMKIYEARGNPGHPGGGSPP